MSRVQTGINRLRTDKALQKRFSGNVAVLCHSASIDHDFTHTIEIMKEIFEDRVTKIFGPQHGFVTDVQDNMIETDHFTHPYFKIPVYSLYSETRIPTDEMLENIDHLFIDLQDVGTRIYTYIYTMTYILEKCASKDIQVIVLDRPNPINAETIEGNILKPEFTSFVGRHPIPVRHGLTIGEVALMHQSFWTENKCNLEVIKMENYKRDMDFLETNLPYVNPSPNLPTLSGCYTFVGTVLFEGTNISEGRGTTRALELVGHPNLDPWRFQNHLNSKLSSAGLKGCKLRPTNFYPMFQKHKETSCGGYQIHVLDKKTFKPWRVSQILLKEMMQILGDNFEYKKDAYEYEYDLNPIDLINGDNLFRKWYKNNENHLFLDEIEAIGSDLYKRQRENIKLYE